jgi:hypothetical protein
MIKDHLWKINSVAGQHLGLLVECDPGIYPVRALLCSHMGSEVAETDERIVEGPAPPFDLGTRISFKDEARLDPDLFTGINADVTWRFTLTVTQLRPILERMHVLYMTGKLVGRRRLGP